MWCHVVCSHASLRAGWPGPIGSVVAAVQRPDWDFSSTHRTTPCSGGQTYRPTTSRTLAMKFGSWRARRSPSGAAGARRPARYVAQSTPTGRWPSRCGGNSDGWRSQGNSPMSSRSRLRCGILNRARRPERGSSCSPSTRRLHKTPPPTVGPSRPSLAATSLF